MKREETEQALEQISDRHIQEAINPKRKKRTVWLSAVAAVAAIAVLIGVLAGPAPIRANAVSLAVYPKESSYVQALDYKNQLNGFFAASMGQFLSNTGADNAAFSPINLYFSLAMLAETTDGETRAQLLSALGNSDPATLATQSQALWNASYRTGNNPCTLANSLWLNRGILYSQAVMDTLSSHYYASVYQRDLNTAAAAKDIRAWINNHTGGMLKNAAGSEQLPEDARILLASTVSFHAKWVNDFSKSENTQAPFHSPNGDVTATYMNQQRMEGLYYWGEGYGAIAMPLKGGYTMWLILPDEGTTTDQLLSGGAYTQLFLQAYHEGDEKHYKPMYINLSLPKFDITSQKDFREGLEAMGITDVFDYNLADFSAGLPGSTDVCVTGVNQATRVAIDEKGVTAASYIEIPGAGAGEPPDDTVDFILDRPFLFTVTGNHKIPLFAGVVNRP